MTRRDKIKGVGGLALAIENLRAVDVLSFEIRDEICGLNARTELMLKPGLKVCKIGIDMDFCLSE